MGFFNKQLAESGPTLAKLSTDRIKATLDARDANYGVDDDGDVGGYWDGHLFYFFLRGEQQELLLVRARWNRTVGFEHYGRLLELANDWNCVRFWPKVYVRPEFADDADPEAPGEPVSVGVYAEHVVDYEHGVSDEQLDLHLGCAITTAGSFFDSLDEEFPTEAAAAIAEFATE